MSSTVSTIKIDSKYDRVIILIDMDCFYCQVEEKLNPELANKPIAVVQYNAWKGGGIIAVNYPARAKGVTRHMRGDEAKEHCPEIELVKVPNVREKADLTKYREAGKKVAEVLQSFTPLLERASVDEAYLDISEQVKNRLNLMNEGNYKILPSSLENTYCVGYDTIGLFIHEISSNHVDLSNEDIDVINKDDEIDILNGSLIQKYNLNLLIGASIASEIRTKVKDATGYECSAGIAHNKILAKSACGINKPNKQTILSINKTKTYLKTLPVNKIKGLGGKFGEEVCEQLHVKTIGDLIKFTKIELQKKYDEKNGYWLYLIARGIDLEAVTPRFYSKSIGCCKKFPGRNAITGLNTLVHWLNELANEIADRLDKDIIENNRKAKQVVVSFIQEINSDEISSSRSANLNTYDPDIIAKNSLEILQKNTSQFFASGSDKCLNNPIKFLGISVGKFENIQTGQTTLQQMFSKQQKNLDEKKSSQSCPQNDSNNEVNKRANKNDNQEEPINQICVDDTNSVNFPQDNKEVDDEEMDERNVIEPLRQIRAEIIDTPKTLEKAEKSQTVLQKMLSNNKKKSRKEITEEITASQYKKLYENQIKDPVNAINETVPNEFETKNSQGDKEKEKSVQQSEIALTSTVNDLSNTSPHNSPDYTKTYAEFLPVETKLEDYNKCSECGAKILTYNLQTHMDGHIAFQLSQQQREEYRKELKLQFSQNSASSSSKKKNVSNTSFHFKENTHSAKKKKAEKIEGNISKYLKVCEKPVNDKTNVKCPECGYFVDELKLFEHQDLHLAQKMQREWNNQ